MTLLSLSSSASDYTLEMSTFVSKCWLYFHQLVS